mgnify:CR=1 FL=1
MNVAYILNNTSKSNGDTKAFLNMLSGIVGMGVCPFIITPDKEGIYHQLESNGNIRVKAFNYRTCAYPRLRIAIDYLYFLPKLLARIIVNHMATRQLTAYLKENAIDIVHTNVGVVRIGYDAAQNVGIPHIYHIREYANMIGIKYFPTMNTFIRQLNCSNSYSICITKAIQNYYHQSDKGKASRVIYDGVFSKQTVLPTTSRKDYFLFAGRIQPAKGVDQLLIAYSLYATSQANPVPLKIAGSNTDEAYYKQQLKFVEEHRLSEQVEFLGNRDDIQQLMREASALIVSSPFEGFGFCMPEAMQQGCLVIGRNTGGTKEQLDNALDLTGREIALRYETIEQLAEFLSEVAKNTPSFYDDYRCKAFDVVNELYTKERNAKEILLFYKEILAQK